MRKSILYTDMDGTLIGDNKRISPENIGAIRQLVRLGGRFSIATGRSEVIAAPFLGELPINAPAILYNGAAVYDFQSQEFLYRAQLAFDTVQTIVRAAVAAYPQVCVEVYTGGTIKLLNRGGVMDHYILAENQPYAWAELESCQNTIKMIFYGENPLLKEVEKQVYSRTGGRGFVSTFSAPYYFEILPQGVSKGSALEFIIERLGVGREQFAAIGDFYNDVEMIRAASLGAAPSNAPEDVKIHADVVVADNNHHAVAELIERHML